MNVDPRCWGKVRPIQARFCPDFVIEEKRTDIHALGRLLKNNGACTGNGYSRWRRRRRHSQIMRQRVPPQITIPAEDFAAGGAMIRLNIRVREKVSLQVAPLIKTPRTDGTFVRRLFHMQNLVDGQCPALAKSFTALGAFKRLDRKSVV